VKLWSLSTAVFGLALAAPATALANSKDFNPADEFRLDSWVSIHLGPLDLSINKAVAYLALASLLTIALGIGLMRLRLRVDPGTRQTIGESIYDAIQTQIAEQGLPSKAIGRWFPYVASLFLFVWVANLVSFIPLPLTNEKFHIGGVPLPAWGIYAVTSQLSVTLILALFSVVFTHVEGLRWNGLRYFKSFIPAGVPRLMIVPMAFLETISHIFRVVSLSVRLYANMLAGHMLILISIGLIFILSGITFYIAVPISFLIGVAFYGFEVAIVVTIQAFIFAALTAIYIGSAIEPEH
jgi:F-type H+-transporting ATPase subunit a